MEILIANTLKQLRHDRGNTQDDLAVHLGISVQAVSKWERGDGYPDITLLPGIASFYNTTVDNLLGCDNIRKNEKLEEFVKQCNLLLNKGKRQEKLSYCREMYKEYPNEETVLYELMYALYGVDKKENCNEIIRIAEKLFKSENNHYHYGATQILCFTYDAIGQNDKAVEYARMVPANKDLLIHVLHGDELVEHCQWFFWRVCDDMQQKQSFLLQCKDSGYTAEQRHKARKMLYNFYQMIFSDGDFGFWEDRLGRLCYLMALSSAESGDNETAFAELEEMCEHFEKSYAFVSINHTSLLVNKIHYEESMVGRSSAKSLGSVYLKEMENKRFNNIREDPRFAAIKKRLIENDKPIG